MSLLSTNVSLFIRKSEFLPFIIVAGAINFNGGGHLNHTIFWSNMAAPPLGGGEPKGQLADQINKDFGSFDAFKKELTAKAGF